MGKYIKVHHLFKPVYVTWALWLYCLSCNSW